LTAETLQSKLRSGRILLGGHRGNADECPENTLASFQSAIDVGVDVIECDVHLSDDRQLAVIHDHLIDRTTNGSGLVRDYTMAELKGFDAGTWKDATFAAETIPSLDEVLALAHGKVGVAIEIKNLPLPLRGHRRSPRRVGEKSGHAHECRRHLLRSSIGETCSRTGSADHEWRADGLATGRSPPGDG